VLPERKLRIVSVNHYEPISFSILRLSQRKHAFPINEGNVSVISNIVIQAHTDDISLQERGIFNYIVSRCYKSCYVLIKNSYIAKDLGIHVSNIERHMNKLIEYRMIFVRKTNVEKGNLVFIIPPEFWTFNKESKYSKLEAQQFFDKVLKESDEVIKVADKLQRFYPKKLSRKNADLKKVAK
jgi:predicted transcriptional regulator